MANRTKLTPEKKEKFIEALSADGNVTRAASVVKVSRESLYEHKRNDEAFKAAWEAAVDMGTDGLEDEAVRRGYAGSDTLLIFLLKARRPEKYRETIKQEISGADGGVIPVAFVDYRKGLDAPQKDDEA